MIDLGDRYSGCNIAGAFTTVTTTGAPSALSGNPFSLSAWKLVGSWTCSTAGLTLSLDCKGATGWNGFSIDTNADAAFYSCGTDFVIVLNGGTVGGTCVSYYTIATFSLKNRAGLNPTIHARALDVTATGEAGVDWANIGSPQTEQRLGCTSLFAVHSTCNSVTASNSITVGTNNDKTGYRLSATGVDDILDDPITEPTAVFAWASATLRNITGWVGAVTSNRIQQSASQQGVCDRAATVRVALSEVSCSAGVVTRGSFT